MIKFLYSRSNRKMNKVDLNNINFTKYNNEEINTKISNQLSIVIDEILKHKNEFAIISIILTGGFGREEGSVIIKNEKVMPLNDYDIIVVSKKYPSLFNKAKIFSFSTHISKYITNKIEVTVDISPIFYDELKKLPNSIFNYETKYGSKILWGRNVLDDMPNYDAKNIPLFEGIILLFTRAYALLYGHPNSKPRELVILQLTKALHACCEALLLLSKKYHYSYFERNKIFKNVLVTEFPEIYNRFPQMEEMVDKAIKFKLWPDYSLFPDGEKLWKEVCKIFIFIFKYYFMKYYCVDSDNLEDIIAKFLKEERRFSLTNPLLWIEYYRNMKLHNKNPRFYISFFHSPWHFASASLPVVLEMMIDNSVHHKELVNFYLEKMIIGSKSNNCIDELRKKCVIVARNGKFEP